MSLSIRPHRMEVSDRFPILGFTVNAEPGRQWFDIAVSTDPRLFSADARSDRTHSNFYSTRACGPLPVEHGEAVFLLPEAIAKRFVGASKLFYGLATYADTKRGEARVNAPMEGSPWIDISSLSGRPTRGMRIMPRAGRSMGPCDNYGAPSPDELVWAGDAAQPGMQTVNPPTAGSGQPVAPSNGNGNDKRRGHTPPNGSTQPTNGQTTNTDDVKYDDGFGPMPDPTPSDSADSAKAAALGSCRNGCCEGACGCTQTQARGFDSMNTATVDQDGIELDENEQLMAQSLSGQNCSNVQNCETFCAANSAKTAGTTNFQLSEFESRDGTPVPVKFRGNVQRVMDNLEVLRAELGNNEITIVSGYRSCQHNCRVGGVRRSRHLCGQAADMQVAEHTPDQVHAAIERLIRAGRMTQGGLGLYDSFVHYDIRGTPARWNRQTAKTQALADDYVAMQMMDTADTDGLDMYEDEHALTQSAHSWPFAGGESFDVNWGDVQLVPQMTGMSCWAAAASMIVGWRDRISIDPAEIAKGAGHWAAYKQGLNPASVPELANAWGLVMESPQCYTLDGLRQLIENNGPLFVVARVPGVHAVVVTGIYGDGTYDGTFVRINDPWGRQPGGPGKPGTYNPLPGEGSQYELTVRQFAAQYEGAADVPGMNVQILHSGGIPTGTQALADESFDVDFSADVQLVPQLTGMSCWAAAAAMVVGWRDGLSIDPTEIARGSGHWAAYRDGLNPGNVASLAAAWGLVTEQPQTYTIEGLRQLLETNGPLWVGATNPGLHVVVVTGIYGDGTPEGTYVRINDPWGPLGAPKPDGVGSRYVQTVRDFTSRYQAAAPTGAIQVLHSGAGVTQALNWSATSLGLEPLDQEAVARMRTEFQTNARSAQKRNCITIMNDALRQLYGTALSGRKLSSTVQDTMNALHGYGLAASPTLFEFNDARGRLTKGVTRPETLQQSVEAWIMAEAEANAMSGWYVFGLSIMDGYHSVMIAVSFSGTTEPSTRVYWADQITSGWDDVTGQLDQRITHYTQKWWDPLPQERKARTRVTLWPLRPAPARGGTTQSFPQSLGTDFATPFAHFEADMQLARPFGPSPGSNPGSTQADALARARAFQALSGVTSPFRSLNHSTVASRLIELVNDRDLIQQAILSLCGPAAYFNLLLRRDPVMFVRYAVNMFQNGEASLGRLSVEAGSDLKNQTWNSSWGIPQTDWMVMSAMRDSENAVLDFEGTPDETTAGATTPAEMTSWLRQTGLYGTVRDEGNWFFTKGVSHALSLGPAANNDILLLINAHILTHSSATQTKSNEFILSAFPNHFVVIRSPITENSGNIEFQCWTWGRVETVRVPRDTFDANYYGAVIAEV